MYCLLHWMYEFIEKWQFHVENAWNLTKTMKNFSHVVFQCEVWALIWENSERIQSFSCIFRYFEGIITFAGRHLSRRTEQRISLDQVRKQSLACRRFSYYAFDVEKLVFHSQWKHSFFMHRMLIKFWALHMKINFCLKMWYKKSSLKANAMEQLDLYVL